MAEKRFIPIEKAKRLQESIGVFTTDYNNPTNQDIIDGNFYISTDKKGEHVHPQNDEFVAAVVEFHKNRVKIQEFLKD